MVSVCLVRYLQRDEHSKQGNINSFVIELMNTFTAFSNVVLIAKGKNCISTQQANTQKIPSLFLTFILLLEIPL